MKLFTEKQLIEFGNYLLSDERKQLYASHPRFGGDNLEERISMVNDADISNSLGFVPDLEVVAAQVHNAWMNTKRQQGIASRKSESGEELMRPYHLLSEEAKQLDRNSVLAVYNAIEEAIEEDGMFPGITDVNFLNTKGGIDE